MASEKVTLMILDVDLKCPCCYKKVKKLLCKFPQIRDQVFDEAKNKVRITVVCCSPEKIRDCLCCKGGKVIQRIEIVEDKPKQPQKPKEPEKPKPKEPEKPKLPVQKPKEDPLPKHDPPKIPQPAPTPEPMHGYPPPVCQPAFPVSACCPDCYAGRGGGPCEYGYGRPVPPPPGPCYDNYGYPPPVCQPAFPVSACCPDCYAGRGGGPCEYGYGRPVPPPPGPCYDNYGYQYGYGGNRPCFVSRCDYVSEENPQGCWIM